MGKVTTAAVTRKGGPPWPAIMLDRSRRAALAGLGLLIPGEP